MGSTPTFGTKLLKMSIKFNFSHHYNPVLKKIDGQPFAGLKSGKIQSFLYQYRLFAIVSWHSFKIATVALISFLVFYSAFNFQLIQSHLKYSYAQSMASTPAIIQSNFENLLLDDGAVNNVDPNPVIIYPRLGITAPVIFPNSNDDSTILAALDTGTSFFPGTSLPGTSGNTVILGHSSGEWWKKSDYKYIFAPLEQTIVGDKIQINYLAKKYIYQVFNRKVVEPTEVSVLHQTPEDILTLITCTPPGTAWKRLIIQAKLQTYYDQDINTKTINDQDKSNTESLESTNSGFIPGADTTLVARIANVIYKTSSFFQFNNASRITINNENHL